MMKLKEKYHLHLESFRARQPLYHLTEERWSAAVRRHRALAKRLTVTIGWDGDIIDRALATADFMINSSPPKAGLRERAPRLRWIQTTGAGIDALLPLDWLPRDMALTNNHGAHGEKAEESCTWALAALNARVTDMLANQRRRVWQQIFTAPVSAKTVVVLGFGDLGSAAGRAAKKLGAKVIAVTRSGKAGRPADRAVSVKQLDRVLPLADFFIVTTPLTPETRGLVTRERLSLLKPGCGFINIGRAAIVDYDALRDKLVKGELCGAVLDVFPQEPLPKDSPWWDTPGTIVVPHVTCDNPHYIDRLLDTWFANFERLLAGKPLRNRVERKLGY